MSSSGISHKAKDPKKTENAIIHHGVRLKHARLRKGYTLKQLAERVECSESMISKLENSRLSPSLAMLHRLAKELDTTAADLLISDDDADDYHDVMVFSRDRFSGLGNGERASEVKVWFDHVLPFDKSGLLQLTVQHLLPGAEQTRLLAHDGEEFVYVLEGTLELIFEDRTYTLQQGELAAFPSMRGHRYRNVGDTIARSLWVGTPPVM